MIDITTETQVQRRAYKALLMMLEKHRERGYAIKTVEGSDSSMGDLLGCQFDSQSKGGYLYIWSSGWVGRQLTDYTNDRDLIADSLDALDEATFDGFLRELDEML